MKKIIVSLLLTITAITAQAVTNTWCSINLRDGSRQTYLIAGHLTIIPTSTELSLNSPTLQTTYSLSNVISYNFITEESIDAIPQTTTPDVRIIFTSPDEVTIQGISSSQAIRLFSTNGTQYPINSLPSRDGCEGLTISLRSLPTGIYLITLPDTNIPAIKVIRK